MNGATTSSPDWDRLFEIAAAQEGLFGTRQASAAGYSPQLIAHHLGARRMVRVRRGVYRLVHFPAGDHEARAFLDPVLTGSGGAVWDPTAWRWTVPASPANPEQE